jgi:hypothetical protein
MKQKEKKSSENSAVMRLLKAMFEAEVFDASFTLVFVQFCKFYLALFSLTNQWFFLILLEVSLAIHGLMDFKVLCDAEVWVHLKYFGAKGTLEYFFGDFLMVGTVMRFDGVMVGAKDFGAVFAADGEPVLLLAGVN